jgi:hypothetical protein
MGQFSAGLAFIGILVYMVLAFVLTAGMTSFSTGSGAGELNVTGSEGIQESLQLYGGVCEGPRERASIFDSFNSLSCDSIPGAASEGSCNLIEGCAWENESTSFFLFDSPATCGGRVNASFYDQNAVYGASTRYLSSPDVCDLSGLDTSQRDCELLGCNWVDASDYQIGATSGFSTVVSTLGALTGFNASIIGLDGLLAFLYSVFAFYIPLVLLIIAIYFMLPVIH